MSNVQTVTETAGTGVLDRTMCLRVYIGRPGTRRKVDADRLSVKDTPEESQPEAGAIHASKEIIDSPEFKMVRKHDGLIRGFVNSRSLPSLFRGGIYLLPVALVEEVDATLERMKADRERLIETFLTAYPAAVEASRERLGSLFNEAEYPTVGAMRAAFTFETQYLSFSTPGKLKQINKALFEREQQKAAAKMSEAVDEIKMLLRAQAKELVDNMVERLSPGEDGKPKVFRDSLVKNLSEFLGTFNFRNVVDDDELAALMQKARDLLAGIDPKTLRDSESTRASVAKGFGDLKAQLEPMVTDKPKRRIKFEEEVANG